MIRMTMLSIVGHAFAALVMLFLSWYQPVPKITRGQVVKVKVYSGGGGGAARVPAATLKPTPVAGAQVKNTPPPVVVTPPPTPRPAEKTIVRPKKSPTPEATKTPAATKKAATPTPKKPTPSPKATAAATPKVTPKVSPKATGTPGPETKKTPSATGTPKPGPTPAATPKVEGTDSAAPLVIGSDKIGPAGPGIPGLPPIPGGNTGDGSPLSGYDYYRAWALFKIQPNFTVPRYLRAEGLTCLVHFTVMRDGRIVNIRVLKGTNDSILDGLAVRALEATASLPPLPDTYKEDEVELNVLFDYSPSAEQGGSVTP